MALWTVMDTFVYGSVQVLPGISAPSYRLLVPGVKSNNWVWVPVVESS